MGPLVVVLTRALLSVKVFAHSNQNILTSVREASLRMILGLPVHKAMCTMQIWISLQDQALRALYTHLTFKQEYS